MQKDDATYILYSGQFRGAAGEMGLTKAEAETLSSEALVRHIGESGPAKVMKDVDFGQILRTAVKLELLGETDLSSLSLPQKQAALAKLNQCLNLVLSGKDAAGNP